MPIPRRLWLRWAAGLAASAAGAVACGPLRLPARAASHSAPAARRPGSSSGSAGRPSPSVTLVGGQDTSFPAPGPGSVVLASDQLWPLRAALEKAWAGEGRAYQIMFRPNVIGPWSEVYRATDIVEVHAVGVRSLSEEPADLTPLLRARNYSLDAFLPGVLDGFRDGGALRGLPLVLGEFQLYVNAARLKALDVTPAGRWTFDAMTSALDRALAQQDASASSALVAGLGWGDYRLWGAFVLGLGGSLGGGSGHVDFSGAVEATKRLVAWARRYRWDPNATTNFSNRAWGAFYRSGFSGGLSGALFGFPPSYLVYGGGPFPPGSDPTLFPLLPQRPVVPAWPALGLGISPRSAAADEAMDVLLWLLQPAQQRYFAAQGWPPPVASVFDQQWQQVSERLPASTPKFDGNDYLDIFAAIVGDANVGQFFLEQAVQASCERMYGGADVLTEVAQLEKAVGALVRGR